MTAGTHTLEWRYAKDASLSSGLDAAFLDDVNLPAVQLALRRLSEGTFSVDLLSPTNRQVIVQVSSNLINWDDIATNADSSGLIHVLDPAGRTYPMRFYRAISP